MNSVKLLIEPNANASLCCVSKFSTGGRKTAISGQFKCSLYQGDRFAATGQIDKPGQITRAKNSERSLDF